MSTRKRFQGRTTGSGGGGTPPVTPGDRDATWDEEVEVASEFDSALTLFSPDAKVDSVPDFALDLFSENDVASEHTVEGEVDWATENETSTEWTLSISEVTGMPDSYVDEGSANTNFGTAASLLIRPNVLGVQSEARAIFKLDMSAWQGDFTITEIRLILNAPSAVVATSLNCEGQLRRGTVNPFTEGSVTWNNHEDNNGTLVAVNDQVITNALLADTTVTYTWNSGNTEVGESLDNLIGEFLYIQIHPDPGLLEALQVDVDSGEATTSANHPRLEFDISGT